MVFWSVEGRGAEVKVTSPDGDIYPFVITSPASLDLELRTDPVWHSGQEPDDARLRMTAALLTAYRWTQDTFGPQQAR